MNPMEYRKLPAKADYLKVIRVVHYLIMRILLPRQLNLDVVIKEDDIPLWLLAQQVQTNWVECMLIHMNHHKQTRITGFPYEALITKILASFGVKNMGKTMDSTHKKINHSLLIRMRVGIYYEELRNESMDEDEVIS